MAKYLFVIVTLAISATGLAQSPTVLKDSGLKKLAVFVGTWRGENDPDPTVKSPTFAVSTCQWSPNGKYLICDQQVTNQGSTTNNLSIYSRDPDKDAYTLTVVGIPGMQPFSIPITYQGDELYYLGSYTDNSGKKVYTRTVNTFLSPTSYTFKVQSSEDGEHWTTSIQGKSRKIH
ncbi:MAG TPA: DUF1579 family protein [Puia sp.]|jgi:hypothetical protein|nr:DUF1579 family protein [Puia sp.]